MGSPVFALVIASWVDGELGQHAAGVRDHGRVLVMDQADHLGAGVRSPDAEVAQFPRVTERDRSRRVNNVVSNLPDPGIIRDGRSCFRDQVIGELGRLSSERTVRSKPIVEIAELVKDAL